VRTYTPIDFLIEREDEVKAHFYHW
jgi:hypothetical protein